MHALASYFFRAPAPTITSPPTIAATPIHAGTVRRSSTEALRPPTSSTVSEDL